MKVNELRTRDCKLTGIETIEFFGDYGKGCRGENEEPSHPPGCCRCVYGTRFCDRAARDRCLLSGVDPDASAWRSRLSANHVRNGGSMGKERVKKILRRRSGNEYRDAPFQHGKDSTKCGSIHIELCANGAKA